MKIYCFFILTVFAFSCYKKKAITNGKHTMPQQYYLLDKHTKGLTVKNDTILYKEKKLNGVIFSLDMKSNDTLCTESYVNGLLDGVSKKWYFNRQLMEFRIYKVGQKNGSQTAYFENGKMKFVFNANNDKYEGELKEWNIDGKLIHLATFKNGQEEGIQKMWYDNGKIRANYVMLNGKRFGLLGTKNCKNVSDSIFNVN